MLVCTLNLEATLYWIAHEEETFLLHMENNTDFLLQRGRQLKGEKQTNTLTRKRKPVIKKRTWRCSKSLRDKKLREQTGEGAVQFNVLITLHCCPNPLRRGIQVNLNITFYFFIYFGTQMYVRPSSTTYAAESLVYAVMCRGGAESLQ